MLVVECDVVVELLVVVLVVAPGTVVLVVVDPTGAVVLVVECDVVVELLVDVLVVAPGAVARRRVRRRHRLLVDVLRRRAGHRRARRRVRRRRRAGVDVLVVVDFVVLNRRAPVLVDVVAAGAVVLVVECDVDVELLVDVIVVKGGRTGRLRFDDADVAAAAGR